MIILSILICSLENRAGMLASLLGELTRQIEATDSENTVELLVNMDRKEKSTGKKRDELIRQATGEYIVFIDDDDGISDKYVKTFLRAAKSGCDVLSPNGWITTNGVNKIDWEISKKYSDVTVVKNGAKVYLRRPNHIAAIRRELAIQAGFPDISNGEDKEYSNRVVPLLNTEYKINDQIYHYRFSTHNKEYK